MVLSLITRAKSRSGSHLAPPPRSLTGSWGGGVSYARQRGTTTLTGLVDRRAMIPEAINGLGRTGPRLNLRRLT